MRVAGDVALIIGGDGLGEGFEGEGDGEESPELASIPLRTESGAEGGDGGQENDGEIEGVDEEETLGGVVNGDEVKDEERRYEEGEGDEEPGELALGEQANLKGGAWWSVPRNGIAV